MKSKARFLPFVLALALLTSLFMLSPASAVTGTVKLSKSFITTPDGELTITVEDADLNFGVVQSDEDMGRDPRGTAALVPYSIPAGTIDQNTPVRFRTQLAPIKSSSDADLYPNVGASVTDANSGVDYHDMILRVVVPPGTSESSTKAIMGAWEKLTSEPSRPSLGPNDRHPYTFENTQGGAFILLSDKEDVEVPDGGINFTVSYKAPDKQIASVQVTSTQDTAGIKLAVPETGADTGTFTRAFETAVATTNVVDISGGVREDHINLDLDGDGDITSASVSSTSEVNLDDDLSGDGTKSSASISLINLRQAEDAQIPPDAQVGYLDDDENFVGTGTTVTIATIAGSLITVSYDDGGTRRVANATVETTDPTIVIIGPAHDTATRVRSARLIAEVTDSDSGIDEDSIDFKIDATNLAGGSVAGPGVTTTDVTTVTIAGGFRAEVQLADVPAGETLIKWSVVVLDEAGNMAESDQKPDDDEGEEPDLHVLRIDTVAPQLGTIQIDFDGDGDAQLKTVDGAITGNYLNSDGDAVTNATNGDATSIRVVFDEALSEDSMQASDFRVNGAAPSDVSWSSKHSESVFLTVPTMAADARPLVELTGDIEDKAGNVRAGGLKIEKAQDGISPTLAATVTPDYDTEEVTIDVRSDEALLTIPRILLNENDGGDTAGSGLHPIRLIASNHYRAIFEGGSSPMVFNVQVEGKDTSANPAALGKAKAGDDDAITFEIDNQLPSPTSVTFPGIASADTSFDTDEPNKITTQNPFITIEWDSEGAEYGRITTVDGDTTTTELSNDTAEDGDIAEAKANAKSGDDDTNYQSFTDLDTHGQVDVTNLVIGGNDVNTPSGDDTGARTEVTTDDGDTIVFNVTKPTENRLLISARGLPLGSYEMTFNGADQLGNSLGDDVKLAFEVKEPDPFEIKLTPGWNLVSLPAEPQSSAINDVVPADHAASIVLTYDPTQPGAWLSASRGDDGTFAGSLENVSARVGYWIFTDSFDSLKVPVMRQSGGAPTVLPTVNLVAGWNLLPILDVSGGKKFGDDISDSAGYVENVVRTYSYDSSSDRFDPLGDGALEVGSGYWVYMSKATVLVP